MRDEFDIKEKLARFRSKVVSLISLRNEGDIKGYRETFIEAGDLQREIITGFEDQQARITELETGVVQLIVDKTLVDMKMTNLRRVNDERK